MIDGKFERRGLLISEVQDIVSNRGLIMVADPE